MNAQGNGIIDRTTTEATSVKPRLLFVDDEPSILSSLRVVFRTNYDVTATTDGFEAIELLKTGTFDVIVSDQRMPKITGVEVLRHACELAPNTVRILLTGYSDTDAIVGAINDVEVHRFLQKPWDNSEIKRVVNEAIELARALVQHQPVPSADGAKQSADIIPIPVQHSAYPAIAQVPPSAGEKETVLVVASKRALFAQIEAGLAGNKSCNMTLAHAAGVLDVFQALERTPINIIIFYFDVQSDADRTFIQMLKRENPYIFVIAVCDSTDSIRLIEMINQAKIFRFVRTPVNMNLLARYIASAIKQAAEVRANPVLIHKQQTEKMPEELAKSSSVQLLEQHFALVNLSLAARCANLFKFFKRS
jgi:response regulator RpfG family c-di-GMP phosphodiesterase